MDWVLVVGRVLFSLIFVASGFAHFMAHADTTSYAEARGVRPASPMVYLSGLWILAGGLMVILGVWTDLGAVMLVAYLLVAMFWVHHFWSDTDDMMKQVEMTSFMKNLSMAGGGLIIFAFYSNEALQQADALGWELVGPLFKL